MRDPAALAESLALLAAQAPALRAAGVKSFTIDGLSVELSPPEPVIVATAAEPEPDLSDPLDDPFTFGRRTTLPSRHEPEGIES